MNTLFDINEFSLNDNHIHIYVLRLENNKYYVGQTKNIKQRFEQHLKGKLSSEWTQLHKPICIHKHKRTPFFNTKDAMEFENLTTIWCMKRFGWKNFRGGDFCTLNENKLRLLLALNSDLDKKILPIKFPQNHKLKRNKKYIFILKLRDEKYFIGYTTNIFIAILNEYNGLGNEWTKKYQPEELIKLFSVHENIKSSIRELINSFVEKSMREYGFKNVRGGDFFNLDEQKHKNKVLNYTNIFKK